MLYIQKGTPFCCFYFNSFLPLAYLEIFNYEFKKCHMYNNSKMLSLQIVWWYIEYFLFKLNTFLCAFFKVNTKIFKNIHLLHTTRHIKTTYNEAHQIGGIKDPLHVVIGVSPTAGKREETQNEILVVNWRSIHDDF